MAFIDVKNQSELDEALKRGDCPHCVGDGVFILRGTARGELYDNARGEFHGTARGVLYGTARGVFYDNASGEFHGTARGEFYDNARGEFYDNARGEFHGTARGEFRGTARGEFRDNASGVLYDNASGVLYDNARGVLYDNARGRAFDDSYVINETTGKIETVESVVVRSTHRKNIVGKCILAKPAKKPATLSQWFSSYGVKPKNGIVILYKSVRQDFTSPHGMSYAPGTMPEAPDWDEGKAECGGGLHFCAIPSACLEFFSDNPRFVACPVKVKDIAFHKDASYPTKVKAKKVCAPIYEVNIHGEKI